MKRILTSLAAAAALSSVTVPALAQGKDFATQGTFAFGVERAFGIYIGTRKTEWTPAPGPQFERTRDYSRITFLIGSAGENLGDPLDGPLPYTAPRVGFDYFVIDGLSLGGSLAFWSYDDEGQTERQSPPPPNPISGERNYERAGWLFSPRVGYAVMFGDVVGIWPRGGLTYWNDSLDDNLDPVGFDADSHELALTLEFHLIIIPLEHLGITVGPVLDFGITGEADDPDPTNVDRDLHTTNFGIAVAGMFGWL